MKTQRFHRSRYIDAVQTSVIFIKKFDLPMAAARRPTSELVRNNKYLSLAIPPPRKSRSDACFLSLELAWLEFNYTE